MFTCLKLHNSSNRSSEQQKKTISQQRTTAACTTKRNIYRDLRIAESMYVKIIDFLWLSHISGVEIDENFFVYKSVFMCVNMEKFIFHVNGNAATCKFSFEFFLFYCISWKKPFFLTHYQVKFLVGSRCFCAQNNHQYHGHYILDTFYCLNWFSPFFSWNYLRDWLGME